MPPSVAVVVPSHERPRRLARLLDALAAQTLARSEWELVVVFDDREDETEQLLRTHAVGARTVRLPAGTGSAPRQRNVGWRAADAPLIAFTDDDCRPDPGWLERLRETAVRAPGAIVQGTTRPDPHEVEALLGPLVRTLDVDPPSLTAPTCNILYPRAVLERGGGFDERFPAGEDTDLAERARGEGTPHVAAPDALVFHAVEYYSLRDIARVTWKWQHLALVMKRHPHLRRHVPLGVFWKASHATLLLALAGLAAAPRRPAFAALALPYLHRASGVYGWRPGHVGRALAELPNRAAVDGVEIAALARGSVRHRTLFL